MAASRAARRLIKPLYKPEGFKPMIYNVQPPKDKRLRRNATQRKLIYPRDALLKLSEEPEYVKTLADRLEELNVAQDDFERKINIGYANPKPLDMSRHERKKHFKKTEIKTESSEETVESVRDVWCTEKGYEHVKNIIDHYGIYRDLFFGAYFYPHLKFKVFYDYDENSVTPVYHGNIICPKEANVQPHVLFAADPDAYYSILLTCPDGHLQNHESENLHWFLANIPGDKVSDGVTLCEYLPPIPPRGTGFHRYVFVLFRHNDAIDFKLSTIVRSCLSTRSFSTLDFLHEHQDHISPVDLLFFQVEWDESVQDVYHHILDMPEPSFEFMQPLPYHPPQELYPEGQSFNKYLDTYRDKKELNEEVLKERLKLVSPFKGPVLRQKYPHIDRIPPGVPQWLRDKIQDQRAGTGMWKDLYDN